MKIMGSQVLDHYKIRARNEVLERECVWWMVVTRNSSTTNL